MGAGIAGLAFARALELRGIVPDIVERRAIWGAKGTGLFLPGNASRAFSQLGLLPDITKVAVPIRHQRVLSHRGEELHNINTERFWAACGPCLALSRADMHSLLRRGLERTSIEMSNSVRHIRQEPDGCEVTFGNGETKRYELVVGADGIRSRVRQIAFPSASPAYTGNVCWRFVAENVVGVDSWTAMIGRRQTLLAIPISPSKVYVYADHAVNLSTAWKYSGSINLERLFSKFSGPLFPLVKKLPPQADLHFSHIESVSIGDWRKKRVVLIGDAAHASSPSMAEGAGLACEDALLLAKVICENANVDEALDIFVRQRERRVSWVHKQCAARDRMRTLPTFISGPLLKYFGASLYERSYRPLLAQI